MRAIVERLFEEVGDLTLRTTVLLRAFEGLSFAAIGEIVERSELAVRKRYSRGLAALRDLLGPVLDPEGGGRS